jgi:hypothetical protein
MRSTDQRLPCPCRNCSTPETEAERQKMLAEAAAERVLNAAAFELYWADRQAGRALGTPAEYRAKAEAH